MREAFEAWAKSMGCLLNRRSNGRYLYPEEQGYWEAWQAAWTACEKEIREVDKLGI